MSSDVMQVKDLVFGYENAEILHGINLSVRTGEVFCLLGPNGSGKTTLLDCMLGINPPDKGSITIGGTDIASMQPSELAKRLAYIPQSHQKNFPFTVFDVVLMGRTAYTGFFDSPGAEDRKIASDILETMGMSHLSNRDYMHISGGESQLVLIMRALAQEAPLLLMDEPSSHLDFRNEMLLLELIIKIISDNRRSVILTTHSPYIAFFLENRGVKVRAGLLDNGILTSAGTPSEVLSPENIERVFNVKTAMVSRENGKDTVKSIIPISTIEKD